VFLLAAHILSGDEGKTRMPDEVYSIGGNKRRRRRRRSTTRTRTIRPFIKLFYY